MHKKDRTVDIQLSSNPRGTLLFFKNEVLTYVTSCIARKGAIFIITESDRPPYNKGDAKWAARRVDGKLICGKEEVPQ